LRQYFIGLVVFFFILKLFQVCAGGNKAVRKEEEFDVVLLVI